MRILALDIATKCGWAIVNKSCDKHSTKALVYDCNTIDLGSHPIQRWLRLQKEITKLFISFKPGAIVIETNFVYKNIATTALLNQLRGAILLLAAMHDIDVYFIDNNVAKKHMFGTTKYWDVKTAKYMGISKDMMYNKVCGNLCNHSILPKDFDSADAIALALAYYQSEVQFEPLPKKMNE